MKRLLTILTFTFLSIVLYAQKTDGTPNAHLQGRTVLGTLPRPSYSVQNSGIVVVTIWVDQYGTVQKAVACADGTTVTDNELWDAARKAALGAHFNMSADAPALQQGTITYRFSLSDNKRSSSDSSKETQLKFKGIEIKGNFRSFAQKLEDEGFTVDANRDDGIILYGSFIGHPNVLTVISPDPSSNEVAAVSAFLRSADNWSSIEDLFKSTVNLYKEKYGEPDEYNESFSKNTLDHDDIKKRYIRENRCEYEAIWFSIDGNGSIRITINYLKSEYGIIVMYTNHDSLQSRRESFLKEI